MTGLAANSSSFHYQWTYDVFLNFRGEDTRHGFTGNLYHALCQKGVRTFIDDVELKKGDEITPTLLKAIENSRMAISVFSKNYASSTFCLNELVKIHHYIKRKDRLVWPIFYDLEPSEVRHQQGNYGQALTMHKKNFKADDEKIQTWKLALHEVANLSGIHINPRNGYEYQFIERIVQEIFSKINRVPLHVAEYPIGLEPRVLKINSLLEIGSNGKVMLGIYGIGGMGKTTIARAVYNFIADNFEALCFLHDIKENSQKLGLERMQERMLSKILGVDIRVDDVNEGVEIIKMRLKQKRVLLILDNVDKHEQLRKLAGDCNWFGDGSRIIITTRDQHLLLAHGVKRKYDMEAFDHYESRELLCWYAFRNNQVSSSHMMILHRAIDYAKGLPLALEVIGSNLCGVSIDEWKAALDGYERVPNEDIQRILKVSYDGLKQNEKEIFLDIACFFKGKDLEYVKAMGKHIHDFDPSYDIRVLVDKCLIKIQGNWITMHDLIQDMGREIVRNESPKEPGKRSRLWFHQDIVHVLEEKTGTDEVSIIIQDNLFECVKVNWDGEAFLNMKNLKILIFENMEFSESPKYLPNSLRVLKWQGYPLSCLPTHFCPKKLVVFELTHSCISLLKPITKMECLSVLNLSDCKYITKIPDLSYLHDLKKLDLAYCENLIEIHDSVGYLAKLEILNVMECVRLKIFPHYFKLPSLEILKLDYCSSLKYFPKIREKMKIKELRLVGTGIEKLPLSIYNLTQLTKLRIKEHRGRIELSRSIILLSELEDILVEETQLSSDPTEACEQAMCSMPCPQNVIFTIRKSNVSNDFLQTYLGGCINVAFLNLWGCNFTILPACIKKCQFLRTLFLNECKQLREVEGMPPNIVYLSAINCISLSSESRSLLLSEELLGDTTKHYSSPDSTIKKHQIYFCVPTRSIPDWFDQSSKGSEISFWYCNNFPALCLCVLLEPKDDVLALSNCLVTIEANINNEKLAPKEKSIWTRLKNADHITKDISLMGHPIVDHIVVYNLERDLLDDKGMKRPSRKWNHVRICANLPFVDSPVIIKESGIYVIKQLHMMGDIQFTDPEQRLDFISGDQAMFNDLEENNTLVPMLPWTKHVDGTFNDQGVIWNNTIICPSTEEEENDQFIISTKEKELMLDKKRPLIQDDNSATCSNVFRTTKRGRNCPINLDDDDTNATEFQYGSVNKTIGNQVPFASYAEEYEREYNNRGKQVFSSFLDKDAGNKASISGYIDETIGNQEATFIDLDENNTSLAMLALMELAGSTINNQGNNIEDKWLPMLPLRETPLYRPANHQEFQQRQDATFINVEQIPESSEDNRRAKGKEIVIYNDHTDDE